MKVPLAFYIFMCVFLGFTLYSIGSLQSSGDALADVARLERKLREAEEVSTAKLLEHKAESDALQAKMELCIAREKNATAEAQRFADQVKKLQETQPPVTSSPRAAVLHTAHGVIAMLEEHSGIAAPDCLSLGADLTPYAVVVPEKLPTWARPYAPHSVNDEPTEDSKARVGTFSDIASSKTWGDTPSGSGSLEGAATDKAIALLLAVIRHLRQKNIHEYATRRIIMLDIPCGDMNWMKKVLFALPPTWVEYHGIDIVPALIDSHKHTFKAHSWMHFTQRDVVEKGIPTDVKYDFIFSRHMLQHLATKDSLKVLKSIHSHPTAKYLFTTTYPDWQAYVALTKLSGTRVRKLNLQLPPASLGPPVCWGHDFSYSFLALYPLPLQLMPDSEIERA
jgi:2-polyprenyl-3-methyl-5-hydroxy-6-metoxy-1,4-benzoquinol methylase